MDLDLICPVCRQSLVSSREHFHCQRCERSYPIVAGIPDLRIRPDRYLSLEDDRDKALLLAERDDLSFPELVSAYWRMTPLVPQDLAEKYTEVALAGMERGNAYLDDLGMPLAQVKMLDVGCGTGGLLLAAASRGANPVGVDIALRWLVVARRRFREAGFDIPLVAADGAVLPFNHGIFDMVTSVETLEHTDDQRGLLHSCLLAAGEAGRCLVITSNRFSLAPEPTVGLWGIGYLPRPMAERYAGWRRNTSYRYFHPVSINQLRAMLGPRPPSKVGAAMIPPPRGSIGLTQRVARVVYNKARQTKLLRAIMSPVSPFLEVRL